MNARDDASARFGVDADRGGDGVGGAESELVFCRC
jgi:hypothetical protein